MLYSLFEEDATTTMLLIPNNNNIWLIVDVMLVEIRKLKINEKYDKHKILWIIISLIFISIRIIYFDGYNENIMAFSTILGEYLNSVKLDYMSC